MRIVGITKKIVTTPVVLDPEKISTESVDQTLHACQPVEANSLLIWAQPAAYTHPYVDVTNCTFNHRMHTNKKNADHAGVLGFSDRAGHDNIAKPKAATKHRAHQALRTDAKI